MEYPVSKKKRYLEEIAVKVNGYIYYACIQNYVYEEKTIDLLMVEEKWTKMKSGGRLVIGPILKLFKK